jgi:hypothetical protein
MPTIKLAIKAPVDMVTGIRRSMPDIESCCKRSCAREHGQWWRFTVIFATDSVSAKLQIFDGLYDCKISPGSSLEPGLFSCVLIKAL